MKKLIVVFALTLALLILGGCGKVRIFTDVRDLDQLELIQTIGLDAVDKGLVMATAATGMGLGGEEAIVIKNTSQTAARALKEIQNYTSKKYIFFGHTKFLLVGESATARVLGTFFDYAEREVDIRFDTCMFIVKDGTANDVMTLGSNSSESVRWPKSLRGKAPRSYPPLC